MLSLLCLACATPSSLPPKPATQAERMFVTLRDLRQVDESWAFFRYRPGVDSLETKLGEMRRTEAPTADDTTRRTIVTSWSPPFESIDTLVTTVATFAPIAEMSEAKALRFRYTYDGQRVSGEIQRNDSSARRVTAMYDESVFAFEQLEQLVAALRFRPGLQVVLPLFSEADGTLEHDTLTVLRDTTIRREPAWLVRFADAVITTRYTVSAASRRILDAQIRQRRSGIQFHLVPLERH